MDSTSTLEGPEYSVKASEKGPSQLRRENEELKALEQIHRAVVDTSLAGICISQKGRYVFVNRRFAEIFGYKNPDEIIGRNFWDLAHPADREMVKDRGLRRERGEDPPDHYEIRVLKKEGSLKWMEIRVCRADYMGKPATVATVIDITERKRAEESLRESEEKYRLLAENTTDVIFIQDMDLNITYVSPSVTQLSGYTVEEMMDLKMEDIMTPDSLRRALGNFREYVPLARKDPDVQIPLMQYEYVRKDGSTFWGELKVKFLRDAGGELVGTQGILRDITERKAAEDALREKEQELLRQAEHLQEVNTTLKVLLDQREEEERKIKGEMASNLDRLIYPYIDKVEKNTSKENQTYLRIIRANLNELFSASRPSRSLSFGFTPAEIEVADLIKQGKTSKEIAVSLNISVEGVAYHRKNIRKKLGLSSKKENLRVHLFSARSKE